MQRLPSWPGALVLGAAGFVTWAVYSLPALTGRATIREAWDTAGYWKVGLPVLLALVLIAGALTQSRAWLLAIAAIAGQVLGMLVIAKPGTSFALLPLTVAFIYLPMFLVFAAAAWLGGWIARMVMRAG